VLLSKQLLASVPVGECLVDVSESGKRCALVFQDSLTKWLKVCALSDCKVKSVAQFLVVYCTPISKKNSPKHFVLIPTITFVLKSYQNLQGHSFACG